MNSTKIKVCGMTDIEQVQQLAGLEVDYAGFIFYEKTPRFVGQKIDPHALKQVKALQKVGVFVNETFDNIAATVERYGLDAVQLHGDEMPELCYSLKSIARVIKVFRIKGEEDISALAKVYEDSADYFLFDTKAQEYGGTGRKFDWSALESARLSKPYFLSGGIGPGDVEEVKSFIEANPVFSLDLNSRFETAPGVKDMDAVRAFCGKMR